MRLLILLLLGFSSCLAWAEGDGSVFDILEYRVAGNTVLPAGKVEETVYPHMGEAKSIDDVEQARVALEKAYRDAGYPTVFVNIPEQKVEGGLVRLQVTEGGVERLRVVDSQYTSLEEIKSRVPELAEGKTPHFPTVQKQLASVNRGADRQVAPVLRPGKTPGKVEVDLKVKDQLPFHGGIELNNRYSANTTHSRLSGSLRYDNLWQLDHSLGISFQVTPEATDETRVIAATYVIPDDGDFWAAYGVISKSEVVTSGVGDFRVLGDGTIVGLRYIHPLPGLTGYTHSLTAGIDYKDFGETIVADAGDGNTPISYVPFSLGYDGNYQGDTSSTKVNLGLTFSIRGLGNDEQEFADKRFLASPDFAALRVDLKHTRQLPAGWQVFAHFSGQATDDPLISNEQFAIGGADSVRGYLESNSMGDEGVAGSLELRTPSLAKYLPGQIGMLYAFAFYDAGHVRIRNPLPAQTASFTLESTGVGLQLKNWRGFSGGVDYAHALHDAGQIEEGDSRLHFRIGYDW